MALLTLGWFKGIGWYEYLFWACIVGGLAIHELMAGWKEQTRTKQYLLNQIGLRVTGLVASRK